MVTLTAPRTEASDAGFRWDRLSAASAFGYCLLVAGLSVGVILGELRDQFHLSGLVAALHGSTFGIGLLAIGILGVRLVGRIGRRPALQLAAALIAAGIVLLCVGPAWPVTLLGTVLSGFGGALMVMVMPGIIADHHGANRAEAFAAVNGAPGLAGVTFSLVIGAALALGWSWRLPYLAVSAVIVGLLVLIAHPVAIPATPQDVCFSLQHFRRRNVVVPYLFIVNAVLCEFTIGIWAVPYLKEVGRSSGGTASALAGVFGLSLFLGRMVMAHQLRLFGRWIVPAGFCGLAIGAMTMCLAPGLVAKTLGLAMIGLSGSSLYPLTVDRLYAAAGGEVDSVSLGAVSALASGTAISIGPLVLGVLADRVGLRWAILVLPSMAVVGAVTQRPRRLLP